MFQFNWASNNQRKEKLLDVIINYKKITEEFCNYYYSNYDNNYLQLSSLYRNKSLFTYLDEELTGFDQMVNKIKQYGINKFKHHEIKINAQPIHNKMLIINATGIMSVNNSLQREKFVETIILQRENKKNTFFISNTIFKLIK